MRENIVYLAQTDTTVGFLSTDPLKLAEAKNRKITQPFLLCVDTFKKQKKLTRTPKKFRALVRRSKKTTFLYPNKKAIRVVHDSRHNQLLKGFDFLYSTSANAHQKAFLLSYAIDKADIMIVPPSGFEEADSSRFYRLTSRRRLRLR